MTQGNPTSLTLNVSGDGVSANISSVDPQDLLRLLQLCGMKQGLQYALTQTSSDSASDSGTTASSTESLVVNTDNAELISRLLTLSGIEHVTPAPAMPAVADTPCGCDDEQSAMVAQPMDVPMMEQQAEYDYGHRDADSEQDEFDLKDYNFKGRADLPERLTNARYGSNALASEMRESILAKLTQDYASYLEEGEIPNEDGRASPLTAEEKRAEFDKDPFEEEPDTEGSRSPLSTVIRQHVPS